MLLGGPSTNGLSTSKIHDNQPAEAGDRHSLSGANLQHLDDRAIVQWHRQLECNIHKADTLNNFDEKTARCNSCFRQ